MRNRLCQALEIADDEGRADTRDAFEGVSAIDVHS